jgi:Na+-transporting NADH:ubiquinone oxidoreductase subunit NqrB
VRDLWETLLDWMDESTGLKISTVDITRWNVISTLVVLIATAIYGFGYVGSWRTFAVLFGGYMLGALWVFMRREQSGDE